MQPPQPNYTLEVTYCCGCCPGGLASRTKCSELTPPAPQAPRLISHAHQPTCCMPTLLLVLLLRQRHGRAVHVAVLRQGRRFTAGQVGLSLPAHGSTGLQRRKGGGRPAKTEMSNGCGSSSGAAQPAPGTAAKQSKVGSAKLPKDGGAERGPPGVMGGTMLQRSMIIPARQQQQQQQQQQGRRGKLKGAGVSSPGHALCILHVLNVKSCGRKWGGAGHARGRLDGDGGRGGGRRGLQVCAGRRAERGAAAAWLL